MFQSTTGSEVPAARGDACALRDERGAVIDLAVPDMPRALKSGVIVHDQVAQGASRSHNRPSSRVVLARSAVVKVVVRLAGGYSDVSTAIAPTFSSLCAKPRHCGAVPVRRPPVD